MLLINHLENKRQGGARNTAVRSARGEYVFYIDQDDYLTDGSVPKLIDIAIKQKDCDIIMFDNSIATEEGKLISLTHYTGRNVTDKLSGGDFLKKQEIPWTPWNYMYRRGFLTDNNIWFVENCRFEDVDYVMECTINARNAIFVPMPVVVHTRSAYQQTAVGDSIDKITDLLYLSRRVGLVAEKYFAKNANGASVILNHHYFGYKSVLKKLLWRLKFSEIRKALHDYPPCIHGRGWSILKVARDYPNILALIMALSSPMLRVSYYCYKRIKG